MSDSKKPSFKKAKRVFRYIKPYRVSYVLSFVFLLLSSLTAMLFPFLMGKLFDPNDTSISNNIINLSDINSIVLSLFLVFAAQSVFSFFRIFFGSRVVEGSMKDLRDETYSKLVSMPMNFFNRNKVGELTSRISSDISLLHETLSVTLTEFVRQFIIVLIGLLALAFISFKLSLIMLATVPGIALFAVFFGRYIKRLSRSVQDELAESNQVVEESLTGIVNVKAFANEAIEIFRFKKRTENVYLKSIRNSVWRGLFVSFIIFFMFGAIVFVVWQGQLMVNTGELDKSMFFSFLFYTMFIGASFGSIPDLYAKIQRTIGGTEKLMDLLEDESEKLIAEEKKKERFLSGKIEFDKISFTYPTRKDVSVLENVNFCIEPGQQLALVGSSGSGKSTIVSLVLQFYINYEGNVLFDNKNAREINLTQLREHMALVPQEVILFSGTIKDNIRYGKPNATENEIVHAAKQANAWDFIQSFPDGLNTLVGDRGIQLSGGQKQRIAIARAVLKNPVILLLDEATSSLDSESERIVQDALEKLMRGRTTIVIAHRLSTIKNADKILVFDKGKIIEQGNHSTLIHNNSVYARLLRLQTMTSPLQE